jgi:hypothetical protein
MGESWCRVRDFHPGGRAQALYEAAAVRKHLSLLSHIGKGTEENAKGRSNFRHARHRSLS